MGYVTLVIGVAAFLQKNDQRLRALNATECVTYALHFWLLGNLSGVAGAGISSVRSYLSLFTQSIWVAAAAILVNLTVGLHFVHSPAGLLPLAASVMGTIAVFLLSGISMRAVMLCSSLCWLSNNLLCHSIGGTILESFISCSNIVTIVRLSRDNARAKQMELPEASEA